MRKRFSGCINRKTTMELMEIDLLNVSRMHFLTQKVVTVKSRRLVNLWKNMTILFCMTCLQKMSRTRDRP
eukprot:UN09821